jgi:hypothetical protein
MELKDRSTKILNDEDVNPQTIERCNRDQDEMFRQIVAAITAIESRLTAIEARLTAHSI